ncbi:hypothetical protein EON79_09425 [bacterium]|nr:MAG: hypothetical protein EON79_09425 [bacterium]
MRSAICIAAMATVCLAAAQHSFLRRVGAGGLPLLDGQTVVSDVRPGGWSLLRSQADNATSPASYLQAYLLRSPSGTIEPVPLPDNPVEIGTGAVRADGEITVFPKLGELVVYRRSTRTIQRFPLTGPGAGMALVVGETATVLGPQGMVQKVDLVTGEVQTLPRPRLDNVYPDYPLGISADGRWSIWGTYSSAGYLWIDLTTHRAREWTFTPDADWGNLGVAESSGRAMWEISGRGTAPKLLRHDFILGETAEISVPQLGHAWLRGVAGRYVYFTTPDALVAEDTNDSLDAYAYNRATGEILLVSKRAGTGAAGEVTGFWSQPDSSEVFFTSAASGVTPMATGLYDGLYRHNVAHPGTEAVIQAAGPAGRSPGSSVLSDEGHAALLVDSVSVRIDRAGTVLEIPTEGTFPKAGAVADDGTVAAWLTQDNKLHIWRQGLGTRHFDSPFSTGAVWEPVTCKVFFLETLSNQFPRLCAYDVASDTLRRYTNGEVSVAGLDAAGGFMAFMVGKEVRVWNLTTESEVTIPLDFASYYVGPRLTGDGLYVSVAGFRGIANSIGRYYKASTGEFRRTTPYGLATRDSRWLDSVQSSELIYESTGARFNRYISAQFAIDGPTVGPEQIEGDYVYRVKARTLPELFGNPIKIIPNGQVELQFNDPLKAGLENARTWVRYRFDGGAWNIPADQRFFRLTLPDGPHTFEAQAVDDLGRFGKLLSRSIVVDSVPPTVGVPKASRSTKGLLVRITSSDSVQAQLTLKADGAYYGNYSPSFLPEGGYEFLLRYLPTGRRYTFTVKVTDAAGNSTTSAEGSFRY